MSQDLQSVLEGIYQRYLPLQDGRLADYIPELGKADRNKFGISICDLKGKKTSAGDHLHPFTIQSISKTFVFAQALKKHGLKHVRSRVGFEPTGEPFHSIIRLDSNSKRPFNPFVNTGAIAMTNLIREATMESSQASLIQNFENYVGHRLQMDEAVYESEKNTGHRNRAIAFLMLHFGMVEPGVEETLDLYFRQCSYQVCSDDLSVMAATLANGGVNPLTGVRALDASYVKYVLSLMFTCGLYTYAGDWAFDVGIPAKSGVSGGIMAVVPGKFGIGLYSPLVDKHGSSIRGVKACKALSDKLGLHVLGPS